MKAEPILGDFGLMVECAEIKRPGELDPVWLREAIRRSGIVVLRRVEPGRSCTSAAAWLAELAATLSDRVAPYPGRSLASPGGEVQKLMDARTRALQLHCEHAWHPLQPDLGIFMCLTESQRPGGETALAYGGRLLAALPERAQRAFTEQRIRYISHMGSRWWRAFHGEDTDDRILEDLNALPGVRAAFVDSRVLARYFDCELLEDQVLRLEYVAPAVIAGAEGPVYTGSAHRHDYQPFLAGIRYGKSQGELAVWAVFEDGREIDQALRLDVDSAGQQQSLQWLWRRGDVALINNWSVLHGRQNAGGEGRQLLSAWGHLRSLRPVASGRILADVGGAAGAAAG